MLLGSLIGTKNLVVCPEPKTEEITRTLSTFGNEVEMKVPHVSLPLQVFSSEKGDLFVFPQDRIEVANGGRNSEFRLFRNDNGRVLIFYLNPEKKS